MGATPKEFVFLVAPWEFFSEMAVAAGGMLAAAVVLLAASTAGRELRL